MREDLTNCIFGVYKVIEFYDYGLKGMARWKCKCLNCGNEFIYYANNLKRKKCNYCKKCKGKYYHNKLFVPNKYEINGDIIVIKTNTNQDIIIDKEDYKKICSYHWYIDNHGYAVTSNTSCEYNLMHRLILLADDNVVIDHRDGNPLNNTKNNLRICTQAENNYNKSMQPFNTSGVTGVSYDQSRNKWTAQIGYKGKIIHLGRFTNFNDAVKARKEAEEKYFGEYSYDNSRTL